MKKYLYTLLLSCILTPSIGQTLDKALFSSSSSDYNSNSYSISWSVGEVMVNKKNELSVGFHASTISIEKDSSTLLSKKDDITFNFSLYPNPTTQFVHISSTTDSYQKYTYRLYSITGKLIEQNRMDSLANEIDLSNKNNGVYLIKIYAEKNQNPIQSFKIIKKMKKLLRLPLINFLILFSFNLFAQTQNAFNFQAVIRNDTGELLSNQEIKVLFEILENNPNGEVIFLQESDVTSNKYGLITAEIGNDEIVEGDFSNISWSENSYFIRISVDFEASGNYEEIGVSQLLSVPYAMYAKSSGNSYWEKSEEGIYNSTDNVSIGSNSPSNLLSISLPETGDQKDKGFSLSRNDGFLNLINGTLYDGHFQARISGKSTHEDSPGIIITATPAIDEINKNGIVLRSGENALLQNANALTVQNFDQSLVTVKPDGKTGFGLENPNYQVDVNGGVNASNFYISGEAIKSGVWNENQNDIFFNSGNIGVGNSSPNNLLNISLPETGDQKDKGFSLSRNDGFLNLINGTLYDGHFQARISGKSTHEDSPGIIITATPAIDEINKNGIILRSGEHAPLQNANALTVQNFDQSLVTVKPDGKTGFGLENPNYQVDVNGGVNASNFYISGEAIKSGVWNENQNDIFFNSGNIGVGNSSPNNLLNISLPETGDQKDKGFSLSRNDGFLNLINGTLYDGHFQARISGKSTHEDSPGIIITATPAIDEINKNGIILRSGEHAPLQNANALTVQNFDQSLFTVKADGKTGIGTTNPKSKLQVTNGDIYIENASSGVIMTSPDGNCWRMTVDNTGNPQFSSVTCPE